MNPRIRKIVASTTLAAAVLGAGATAALAQDDSTTQSAPTEQQAPARPGQPDPAEREARRAEMTASLAEQLGISVDEVTAAHDAARDVVEAQYPRPDLSERPTTPPSEEERAEHQARREAAHQLFEQTVADNLGISVDELRTARAEAASEDLAERVANGEITQEQADAIVESIRNGEPPHHKGPRPGGPPEAGSEQPQGS